MLTITVGGQAGAGGPEVGRLLANSLGVEYVEKRAIRQLARRLRATPRAIVGKEMNFGRRSRRVIEFFDRYIDQLGSYGVDQYGYCSLAPGLIDVDHSLRTLPGQISDSEYVESLRATEINLAAQGKMVIVKRAGAAVLRDRDNTIHIGLFAPRSTRIQRLSGRLGIRCSKADELLRRIEAARAKWFEFIAGTRPMDRGLYDISINTEMIPTYTEIHRRVLEELEGILPPSSSTLFYRPARQ